MEARLGGATPADDPASLAIREHWDYVEAICRQHLAGMRIEDVHDARQETFLQFNNAVPATATRIRCHSVVNDPWGSFGLVTPSCTRPLSPKRGFLSDG
jgi:hypothetical protein